MTNLLEAALGVLNGGLGDYLARTGNGLATPMECIHGGAALPMERAAIARAHPAASPSAVVLVHGLMCTEAVWNFEDGAPDYGACLARDLGYTPFYVRYNSGLSIPENGAALAALLEALTDAYPAPLEEILPLGFSMGGLLIRSACHAASLAGHRWLARVRRAIYVGTPHLGAPLERAGRIAVRVLASIPDPYTRLAADLGNLRSDGIRDLGDADLRHEDRARPRVSLRDREHPVPLLPGIRHYLAAGTLSNDPRLASLFGDAIVPVQSGTNGAIAEDTWGALPPSHVKLFPRAAHLSLARHPDVYAQIRAWCEEVEAS